MAFKIGDIVICVDDSPGFNDGFVFLELNKEYTIREVYSTAKSKNPQNVRVDGDHMFWHCTRFHKIDPFKSSTASKKAANDAMKELKEYNPQETPEIYPEKSPVIAFCKLTVTTRLLIQNQYS